MPEFAETTERMKDLLSEESMDDQDPTEDETESLITEAEGESSEYRDALAKRAGDVFGYLKDRAVRYGTIYPFDVDVHALTLTLRSPTVSRRFYLYLLSCACFRYVSKRQDQTDLAAKFELVGIAVLKQMLPESAEVHLFGANPLGGDRYPGLLPEKIKTLASDLGEKYYAKEKDFEKGDRGDNGLDLVAWIPLMDELPGRISVFAQAACTPHWVSKQHSSKSNSWSKVMSLTAEPVSMVFIPYDYRRPGPEWYTDRHIHNSAVVDRYRIIRMLSAGPDPLDPIHLTADLLGKLNLNIFDEFREMDANYL